MIISRISYLQKFFKKEQIESVLITNRANIFYLTGWQDLEAKILITPSKRYLFTDSRYIGQAQDLKQFYNVIIVRQKFITALHAVLQKIKIKRVGYEVKHTSVYVFNYLKKHLPDVVWQATVDLVEKQREVKSTFEVGLIKKACAIVDKGFAYIKNTIVEGISEKTVAWELEKFFRESGADDRSFNFIVASGKNAWIPHYKTSDKKIKKGEMVVIDVGVTYKGYCSDATRTFFLPPVSSKMREIYQIVAATQTQVIKKARVGMRVQSVDAITRRLFEQAGYLDHFWHSTGHGVGIEIHERPTLSFLNLEDVLKNHSVITIEPGIYIQDWGGIRIEDTVLVKDKGLERLTTFPRTMYHVDTN